MNLNELAREICKREGGKVNLPIAQVKEVIRIYRMIEQEEQIKLLAAYLKKYKRRK